MQHRWLNRLQTGLLVLTLVGIAAAAGSLLFGESGLWLALFAVAGTLLLEPAAASAEYRSINAGVSTFAVSA